MPERFRRHGAVFLETGRVSPAFPTRFHWPFISVENDRVFMPAHGDRDDFFLELAGLDCRARPLVADQTD